MLFCCCFLAVCAELTGCICVQDEQEQDKVLQEAIDRAAPKKRTPKGASKDDMWLTTQQATALKVWARDNRQSSSASAEAANSRAATEEQQQPEPESKFRIRIKRRQQPSSDQSTPEPEPKRQRHQSSNEHQTPETDTVMTGGFARYISARFHNIW